MPSETELAITSLAILKANWDQEGRDFIDNFVPFVLQSLRILSSRAGLVQIQASVKNEFGLTIPQGALSTILTRAVRRGAVEAGQGTFELLRREAGPGDFPNIRDQALVHEQLVLARLVEFAGVSFNTRWSDADAEQALLQFVQERGASLLTTAERTSRVLPSDGAPPAATTILSSFVVHLHEQDAEGFACLETLVKGALLASALYFPDLGRLSHRFDRLDVFLDTRLVLHALGTAGSAAEMATRELLELAYQLGARLRCFDHTLAEVNGVLSSDASALRSKSALRTGSGESLEYLASAGWRPSDVELLISRLPSRLEGLRVGVVSRPAPSPSLPVNEAELDAALRSQISYRRDETVRHDVEALAGIFRLRMGEAAQHIESARAVFVTANTALVRASRAFFSRGVGEAIPLCFSDGDFTTITWLKKPLAAPDLPTKFILADAYAAVNPSGRLWQAYLDEAQRLEAQGGINAEDYFLLRYSVSAKRSLLELTKGSPDAFGPATIPEILDRVRAATRAELEPELAARAREQAREEAVAAANRTGSALVGALSRAEAAERGLAAADAKRVEREAKYARIGVWSGRLVAGGCIIVLAAVVLAGLFLSLPWPGVNLAPQLHVAGWVLLAVFFVVAALSLVGGVSLLGMRRSLEVRVARRVERMLLERIEGVGERVAA